MDTTLKLKPCPHCGEKPKTSLSNGAASIYCPNEACGNMGILLDGLEGVDLSIAAQRWNVRSGYNDSYKGVVIQDMQNVIAGLPRFAQLLKAKVVQGHRREVHFKYMLHDKEYTSKVASRAR